MKSASPPLDTVTNVSAKAHAGPFRLAATVLIASVFLQKFALIGTGSVVPLNAALFPLITIIGFATQALKLNLTAFLWYVGFLISATISLIYSDTASPMSFGLLILVQTGLVFAFSDQNISQQRLFELLSNIGLVCAALGVLQFLGQFLIGPPLAFFIDVSLPPGVLIEKYNLMNPLYYGSGTFKSNGVFFLEPSFFSQFMAIVIISELNNKARLWRLVLFLAGLLASYSGTGLTTLALYLPFYIITTRQARIVLFCVFVALLAFLLSDILWLDAITRRIGELADNQSSGSARFVSILRILGDLWLANNTEFLLGRGPGTVQDTFARQNYLAFDPTWGKLLYEYGLIGTLLYIGLFFSTVVRGAANLRFALSYTYLMLGSYLLNPSILMQLAALTVWLGHYNTNERKTLAGNTQSSDTRLR